MENSALPDKTTETVFKQQAVAIPPEGSQGSITWTASEFVAHHKNFRWYLALMAATIILDAGIWLITKDKITTAVIFLVIVLFGVAASRKPRELDYKLDNKGLTIGRRFFAYNELKSFAIIKEGAFSSLVFTPFKRFAAWIKIYYDPADEPKILALLASHVPMEEKDPDLTDRFMWRIKF